MTSKLDTAETADVAATVNIDNDTDNRSATHGANANGHAESEEPKFRIVRQRYPGGIIKSVRVPLERRVVLPKVELKAAAEKPASQLLVERLKAAGMAYSLLVPSDINADEVNVELYARDQALANNMPRKQATGIEPRRLLDLVHITLNTGRPLHEFATSAELKQLDAYFRNKGAMKPGDISLVDACARDEKSMTTIAANGR